MTKRELITALEALQTPDDTPVVMPDLLDVQTVALSSFCDAPIIVVSDYLEDTE